jgi:hypothetical protein
MLSNYNGKHNVTQEHVVKQGRKSYFAIKSKLQNHDFNIKKKFSIFDTHGLYSPVAMYFDTYLKIRI